MCIIGNGCVVDPEEDAQRDRGTSRARRRRQGPALPLRPRERPDAVAQGHRPRRRGSCRGEAPSGRQDVALAALQDKSARPASVSPTCSTASPSTSSSISSCLQRTLCLRKLYGEEPDLTRPPSSKQYGDYGERLAPYVADTLRARARGGGCGPNSAPREERRVRCSTSIWARTLRHLVRAIFGSGGRGGSVSALAPVEPKRSSASTRPTHTRRRWSVPDRSCSARSATYCESGPRPECGSTTGQPRRCGWFDGVAARYSSPERPDQRRCSRASRRSRPVSDDQRSASYRLGDKTLTTPCPPVRTTSCAPSQCTRELPGYSRPAAARAELQR